MKNKTRQSITDQRERSNISTSQPPTQHMKTLFYISLSFLTTITAHAHNNLFFPGDAYFSTALSEKFVKKLSQGEKLQIPYHRYSTSFMLCGYAGIRSSEIVGLPESTRKNLESTLLNLFTNESEKSRTQETENGPLKYFPVLIYNKDFNFTKYPVALKFNENFESEQIEKAKRGHAVDDRGHSKTLRKFDNEHTQSVRALDTKSIPTDLTAFMGVQKPVLLDGSKIVFVVLLGGKKVDLEDHASRKAALEIIIVGDTVSRMTQK